MKGKFDTWIKLILKTTIDADFDKIERIGGILYDINKEN